LIKTKFEHAETPCVGYKKEVNDGRGVSPPTHIEMVINERRRGVTPPLGETGRGPGTEMEVNEGREGFPHPLASKQG